MNATVSKLSAALLLAAACALPAHVTAQDNKQALASRLAELQVKTDGAMAAQQLTASAVQVPLANWNQRLQEEVPAERREEVGKKLDAELDKFAGRAHELIESRSLQAAQSSLAPIFIEKLSADEMQAIITYLESPAHAKLQGLGADAGDAWMNTLVEVTRPSIEQYIKDFDTAAERILAAEASPAANK